MPTLNYIAAEPDVINGLLVNTVRTLVVELNKTRANVTALVGELNKTRADMEEARQALNQLRGFHSIGNIPPSAIEPQIPVGSTEPELSRADFIAAVKRSARNT